MTAGGEHSGLHKRWLERKLEIEVGKVQTKLLSKGLTVPVPDPEALETEARLAQSHLPKLYIELYGRNPNGTLKLSPDANKRSGPLPPATVVQKLDRMLNPALLTPLPVDLAIAHGLPLSCCDLPDPAVGGAATARGGQARAQASHVRQGGGGGGGGGWTAHGAVTESGGSPRASRSPPPPVLVRPDLQAADARIDDAVAEVHRVALQANEMTPRDRVLFLARQVNPNFHLLQPRSVQLVGAGGSGASRRDLFRKSFSKRQLTTFNSHSEAANGGGGGRGRVAASGSRRAMGSGVIESRRGREPSSTSVASSGTASSGAVAGEGSLPPLATRSRSISRASSGQEAAGAAQEEDALPRLSPAASPVPPTRGSDEGDGLEVAAAAVPGLASGPPSPGTKLPPVHWGGEPGVLGGFRISASGVRPDTLIGLWGAAAIVHAAETEAARAAAEAEAAEAEAAAAAAEAEAEAVAAAAEAALEAEVEAEARAAAGLLSQPPAVLDGGAVTARRSGEFAPAGSGGGASRAAGAAGHHGPSGGATHGPAHGGAGAHGGEPHHGGSAWMP